jgi:chaperone BCS1
MDGTLAALVFMAAGAGMSVLREVPRRAASLLADLFSISIAVDENDPVHWFATWLAKQPYGGRCRRLKLWVKWRNFGDFGQESTVSMVELEPGLGPHLFRYRGRWFLLTREEHQQREHYADRTRLHLRTLGRSRQPLQALVQEVVEHGIRAMREQDLVRVNDDGGSWRMLEAGESRRLESVVLPRDERALVLADMQRFMARKEWYASRGIPYRRGYLFFGPPGSGKTSLARSLAHELGLTLFGAAGPRGLPARIPRRRSQSGARDLPPLLPGRDGRRRGIRRRPRRPRSHHGRSSGHPAGGGDRP